MGKLEEENKVVINCEHRQTQKPENVKDMSVFIRYEEYERIIKCGEEHDNNDTPSYIQRDEQLLVNGNEINPVDCEECKKMLLNFLTSVVFHPKPNQVLRDMYDKVSSLRRWVEGNREVNGYSTVYEIVNNVERHYMSRDKEWSVTWVDYRRQQPRHPRPVRVMERVKTAEEGFTCAICLQGVYNNNKGTKRKRSNTDDGEGSGSGSGCDGTMRRVVLRLLSCKHMFHKSCIDRWLKDGGHDTCPLCRFQLPKTVRCGFDWDHAKKKALDNSKLVKTDNYDNLCTCI